MNILSDTKTNIENIYQKILDHLRSYDKIAISFSGGVDSSLLLKLGLDALGKKAVVAVTAVSPSLSKNMLNDTKRIAKSLKADHKLIHTKEMDKTEYRKNSSDRCFYCKTELYQNIAEKFEGYTILNGINIDDLGDHRPGILAARKFQIKSPFVDLKIDKETIRCLSFFLQLPFWDKPSSPCLASRIAYGQDVNILKLSQIEIAENFLKKKGFYNLRVRHHGKIARIEVSPEQIKMFMDDKLRKEVSSIMKEIGFSYITLDLEGFHSGSLNRDLVKRW